MLFISSSPGYPGNLPSLSIIRLMLFSIWKASLTEPESPNKSRVGTRIAAAIAVLAGLATIISLIITIMQPHQNSSAATSSHGNPAAGRPVTSNQGSSQSFISPAGSYSSTPYSPSPSQYSSVPLGDLCNAAGTQQNFSSLNGCRVNNGSVVIGSQLFTVSGRRPHLLTTPPKPSLASRTQHAVR